MAKGKRGNWWNKRNDFEPIWTSPKKKVAKADIDERPNSPRRSPLKAQIFEFYDRGFPTQLNMEPSPSPRDTPEKIYRFFPCAEYADSFAQGEIRLSTIETCRGYEDPKQGDRHEGREVFHIPGVLSGNGDDPHIASAAKMLGIHIEPGAVKNLTLRNAVRSTSIEDGYLLCTTIGFAEENLGDNFGRYCVEISRPAEFFDVLDQAIKEQLLVTEGHHGEVVYKERYFTNNSFRPGRIGFVKPPDQYSSQVEYRFLWLVPSGHKIKPEFVAVPDAKEYCKRIA